MNYNITNKIEYIGVNDKTLDLFESQYNLPNGVSYNSYILKDKKTGFTYAHFNAHFDHLGIVARNESVAL